MRYGSCDRLFYITHTKPPSSTHLGENLWSDVGWRVEEVKHIARMLNAYFICLFSERKPIVPGAVEVLVTARAIFQLIAITRANGLLLGYTVGREGCRF